MAARLSEITHWQAIRPVWIWARGWLLVCAWSLLYDVEGFSRFPIPSIGGSTLTGLVLVVGATWLSLWLGDGVAPGTRAFISVAFSFVAGWALVGMLLNPTPTYDEVVQTIEDRVYNQQLTDPDGVPITNIYAYDAEGSPVEVLLFDQDGRPLLTFPPYVYEDAEIPGNDPASWDQGTINFERDQFGRTIPNLYPLELTVYDFDGSGEPVPMTPPSLGFPDADGPTEDRPNVPTTLGYVP